MTKLVEDDVRAFARVHDAVADRLMIEAQAEVAPVLGIELDARVEVDVERRSDRVLPGKVGNECAPVRDASLERLGRDPVTKLGVPASAVVALGSPPLISTASGPASKVGTGLSTG